MGYFGGGGGTTTIVNGTTTITGGTNTRVLFDDSGVVGESAGLAYVKGSGTLTATNLVASTGSTLGVATGTSLALGGALYSGASLSVINAASALAVVQSSASNNVGQYKIFSHDNTAELDLTQWSATGGGTTFGVANAYLSTVLTQGGNSVGLAVGTLTSDPVYIGTNGTARMTFGAAGGISTAEVITLTGAFNMSANAANFAAGNPVTFGAGGSGAASLWVATAMTPDSLVMGTGALSNAVHLAQGADFYTSGYDFHNGSAGTSAQTDPAFIIHSHNQSTTQYLELRHDATNGVITTGTGGLSFPTGIANYKSVATAGWGVPAIYASGQVSAQTSRSAAIATYTVGAADGSFEVSGNINVTASGTHSFSLNCVYTDETNTSRTLVLPLAQLAGTFIASGLVTNVTGAGPYESATMHIRCKASTSITIQPNAGTYSSVTYNGDASIRQIG